MQSPFLAATCAAIIAVAAALPAAAQSESSVYVGAAIGKSNVSSKVVNESGDVSFGLAVGYRYNATVAVEVFARSLSFRLLDGLIGDNNYYPDSHIGMAVLGSMPVAERLSAYARLGLGRTTNHSARVSLSDQHVTDASAGLGLSFALSAQGSVKLEATRFFNSNVNTLSLGGEFRF